MWFRFQSGAAIFFADAAAGEHRDDGADGDARSNALFLRAGRDVENRQHQEKGEDGFENERLRIRTGGQVAPSKLFSGKRNRSNALARIAPVTWLVT